MVDIQLEWLDVDRKISAEKLEKGMRKAVDKILVKAIFTNPKKEETVDE